MKELTIVVVLAGCLVVSAFAGMAEMKSVYSRGDNAATIAEAARVLADPQAPVADKALAQCYTGYGYFNLKQYDKAIPAFQKVITDYPQVTDQCAVAQRYIGSGYQSQNQYDKAISEFQKVISNYPKDGFNCAAALLDIGSCLVAQKKNDEAIASWQKAVTGYASVPLLAARGQRSIAHSYYAQKQFDKAMAAFQKVISNYPEEFNQTYRAEAQLYVGQCYDELKQGAKAQEAYFKVLSDYPTEIGQAAIAFKKVDFTKLPDTDVVKTLSKLLAAIPVTDANMALRKEVKAELDKRAAKAGAAAAPTDPDVRGYWLFDDDPKGGLEDASGQGNNGVAHGAIQLVEGRHGGAYRFNGTDTWVEVPPSASLKPVKSMVIEIWVRPEAVDARQTLLARYEEETNQRAFRLSIENGRVVLDYSGNGSGEYLGKGVGLSSEQRLVPGQWNHVVLNYGARFFSFVINGRADTAFCGMHNPYHPAVPDLFQSDAPLQFGRHFDGKEGKDYFRGEIDFLRISMPDFAPVDKITAWEATPRSADALNNFVHQLLEQDAPKAGAYEFSNAANGWVFFAVTGLTGDAQARLKIGGVTGEVVLDAKNHWEAMRRLPAARYKMDMTLTGGAPARLSVRRVPELLYVKYVGDPDWEWLKRNVLHSVNVCVSRAEILSRVAKLDAPLPMVPRPPAGAELLPEVKEWVGTGREWVIQRTSLRSPWLGLTYKDAYRKWLPSFLDPYSGMLVDEIGCNLDYYLLKHYTDVINQLHREFPNKHVWIWVPGFDMTETNNIFFSALLANGGMVAYERYLSTQTTEQGAREQIDRMFVDPMRQLSYTFPGVQRQILWCPSLWLTSNANDDHYPDVDYKVMLDMEINTLATHPVFRDLAGIVPYSCDMANREITRWLGAMYRYYGIEGGTEPLAKRLGYSYKLDFLTNPGFEKGMEGVEVKPAEAATVGIGEVKDLPQLRPAVYCIGPEGYKYLWMQRSAKSPNVLTQQIRNLKAGETYVYKLFTADLDNVAAEIKSPQVLSINVRGAKIIESETSRSVMKSYTADGEKPVYYSLFLIAFRAGGPTAQVEISDWADAKTPGGPVGQKLYLDFNAVRPLFMGADK